MTASKTQKATVESSPVVEILIDRAVEAARAGRDAESRAYLSGIFEVLADEQKFREELPLSA